MDGVTDLLVKDDADELDLNYKKLFLAPLLTAYISGD
jgi:hypothetical protein